MRLNQKSITIKLNNDLSNQIFEYLKNNSYQSEQKNMEKLLTLGLSVINGSYKTEELARIQTQLDSLIRHTNTQNTLMKHITIGLADVQDAITDQRSDADLLITQHTKTHQMRNNNE